MIKKLIFCSALIAYTSFSLPAFSQQETGNAVVTPIFITPYTQNKNSYNSNIPSLVQSNTRTNSRGSTRSSNTSSSKNSSGYQFVKVGNPYEGTGYGRIKAERNYYDEPTGSYVNQYDYMRLLSNRGETAKLNSVKSYLQQNAVFDPAKYNTVMTATNTTAVKDEKNQSPYAGGTVISRSKAVIKNDSTNSIPQKLHRGYDEEPSIEKQKNSPIFLR